MPDTMCDMGGPLSLVKMGGGYMSPLWTPLGALTLIAVVALAVMLRRERREVTRLAAELAEVRGILAARATAATLIAEAESARTANGAVLPHPRRRRHLRLLALAAGGTASAAAAMLVGMIPPPASSPADPPDAAPDPTIAVGPPAMISPGPMEPTAEKRPDLATTPQKPTESRPASRPTPTLGRSAFDDRGPTEKEAPCLPPRVDLPECADRISARLDAIT